MELKAVKCPSCGADLQVPDDKDYMVCPYCDTTVQVREEIKMKYDVNISNFLKLADEDLKAGNYKEAYEYYNKALESDANNPDAWLGKGVTSGFLHNNINEMMEWISMAVSNCSGEKQDNIKIKAAGYINTIVIGFDSSMNRTLNFVSFFSISGAGSDVYNSVINAMETAHSYSPLNTEILHNLIKVCIHSKNNTNAPGITEKIRKYQDELKQLDSKYDPASDMVQRPGTISQPPSAGTVQTAIKAKGCGSKFLSLGIAITIFTVLTISLITYFVIHTVTDTVNKTTENITKQVEPLKDLKNANKDVPKNELISEYNKNSFHVVNIFVTDVNISTIRKVNAYLTDSYSSKYPELIISYFDDKTIANSYSGVITNPKSYKFSKHNEDDPAAIMYISKLNEESNLYDKSGNQYVKVRIK